MLPVHAGQVAGTALVVGLLALFEVTVGLRPEAWAVGLACGLVVLEVVVRSTDALGPADLVTGTRLVLACGSAALVTESFAGQPSVTALGVVTAVALALDAVDGRVARATGTGSPFGARFDGEVDAFLLLVLSVYVADAFGPAVLAIGGARYAFAMAGSVLPWLRAPLPPRYWRKVVTAVQGVVLLVAVVDVVPHTVTRSALVVALAMLAESFGRDVLWSWRHRPAHAPGSAGAGSLPVQRR